MINLTQEQIQKILAERKVQQAQRDAEDQALKEEKAQREAYWQKIKNKTVTTRKSHICKKCQGTIAKGEQAHKASRLVNISRSGYTGVMRSFYSHVECPKQ